MINDLFTPLGIAEFAGLSNLPATPQRPFNAVDLAPTKRCIAPTSRPNGSLGTVIDFHRPRDGQLAGSMSVQQMAKMAPIWALAIRPD